MGEDVQSMQGSLIWVCVQRTVLKMSSFFWGGVTTAEVVLSGVLLGITISDRGLYPC